MQVENNYNNNGFRHWTVTSGDKKYKVDCLDDVWMCQCALINNRSIKSICKHIQYIKEKC